MPTLYATPLTDFVAQIFQGAGTPQDIATQVATSLVNSNLAGHDSHGVVRVRQYLDSIDSGHLTPDARPQITHESGAICTVDAHQGFGQVAARWTIEQGIARAKENGLAAAGLVNCGHVGRLGEWVELAAEQECIALAFCNGGGARGAVAPFGGAARLLGTNPIAAAIPVADQSPIVLDFATSAVAEGKVRIARNSGKTIPEGWVLNADGEPTTDPNDLYNGGMLLPAATHKGYALSLLVEFLGGVLTGAGSPTLPQFNPGNGVLFLILDIAAFRPFATFAQDSATVSQQIKAVPTAPGFSEILLPGEPEQRTRAERVATGILIDDTTWSLLTSAADDLDIASPVPEG